MTTLCFFLRDCRARGQIRTEQESKAFGSIYIYFKNYINLCLIAEVEYGSKLLEIVANKNVE